MKHAPVGSLVASLLLAAPSALAQQAPTPAPHTADDDDEEAPARPAAPPAYVAPPARFRGAIGGSLGVILGRGGYGGLGVYGHVGVQINDVIGADLEGQGVYGLGWIGVRASALADFTVANWFSVAVGPTYHYGASLGGFLWPSYTFTTRLSFRPSPGVLPWGRRTGFTVNVWLDAGANALPPVEVMIGGFVGLGYSAF